MSNIIKALYNGKISPVEQAFLNDNQYKSYIKNQIEALNKLNCSLTKEQKALIDDYLQKVNYTQTYIHQELFCQGFKIGAKIILESQK